MLFGKKNDTPPSPVAVVPQGQLLHLSPGNVIPSANNPRQLFDPEPLEQLKKNIREHGVLVPITVYQQKGQSKYSILDGARRHRCCLEIEDEGLSIQIPANVVSPPDKIAGLLYMFSIHNFREGWELMPTALSLKVIIEDLNETDTKSLNKLTGLSEPQIERCKILLTFPEYYQNLSLDPNPITRIPSNFWIEAYPLLKLCEDELPDLVNQYGYNGILDKLVEKYRNHSIKSVIHFRRIMEANETAEGNQEKERVHARIKDYIEDVKLETRRAFDEFVQGNRKLQSAITNCDSFLNQMQRLKLDYSIDTENLRTALTNVRDYADELLEKLKIEEAPSVNASEAD